MNKQELVQAVAAKTEASRREAEKNVTAVFDAIQEALLAGDKVAIVGFGTFEVRERAARVGRNPQTGQEIRIAPTRVPAFRPGKVLKEAIEGK